MNATEGWWVRDDGRTECSNRRQKPTAGSAGQRLVMLPCPSLLEMKHLAGELLHFLENVVSQLIYNPSAPLEGTFSTRLIYRTARLSPHGCLQDAPEL